MKVRLFFWLMTASILISACSPSTSAPRTNTPSNLPAQATSANAPGTPTAMPSSPVPELPTLTPTPDATPTASFTPTPSGPLATIVSNATTCMYGPDFGYQVVDTLNSGQVAQIMGRDDNTSWLQIQDPNNTRVSCWVPSVSVTTTGDIPGVQVVMPPMGTITKVSVNAFAKSNTCPGSNRIHFTATVTTTSWAIVDYDWLIKGPVNTTVPGGRAVFKTGGANGLAGNFQGRLPCGAYKVTLRITNPITISVTRTLSIP